MNAICRGCGDVGDVDGLCRPCFTRCLRYSHTRADIPRWLMTPQESWATTGHLAAAMCLHYVLIDAWLEAGQP